MPNTSTLNHMVIQSKSFENQDSNTSLRLIQSNQSKIGIIKRTFKNLNFPLFSLIKKTKLLCFIQEKSIKRDAPPNLSFNIIELNSEQDKSKNLPLGDGIIQMINLPCDETVAEKVFNQAIVNSRMEVCWHYISELIAQVDCEETWFNKFKILELFLLKIWPEIELNMKQRSKWYNRENTDLPIQNEFKLDFRRNLIFKISAPTECTIAISKLQSFVENVFSICLNQQAQLLPKDKLDELLCLYDVKDSIVFIKGANQYIEITKKNGKTQLVNIPLHTIESYFSDSFIRVHRCHLVSKDTFVRVKRKVNGRYKLTLPNISIPVGDNYLPVVKIKCPQWFC